MSAPRAGRRDLMIRAANAVLTKGAGGFLAFVMAAVAANAMSLEDYGRFTFALSLGLFLSVVAQFGVPQATLRFLSLLLADRDEGRAADFLRWSGRGVLLGAAVVAVSGVACAGLARGLALPVDAAAIALGALLAAPHAVSEWVSAALRALGAMTVALAPRDIGWRLATMAAVVGLAAYGAASAAAVIAISAAALALIAGAQFALVARRMDLSAAARRPAEREWGLASRGLAGAMIAMALNHVGEPVLVGLLLGPAETALFFAAFTLAGLANLAHMSVGLAVGPQLVVAHGAGDRAALMRVGGLAAAISTLGGIGVLGLALVAGGPLMRIFGPEFAAAQPIFVVLALGQAVQGACGQSLTFLQLTGRERLVRRIVVVTAVGSVVAFAALTPLMGLMGAAVASSGAKVVRNVWAWAEVLRRDGLDLSALMRPLRLGRPVAEDGR